MNLARDRGWLATGGWTLIYLSITLRVSKYSFLASLALLVTFSLALVGFFD